ncbi:protein TIFY 4B isoform X2 [Jatropha curcas]|uniref:protein TIFY 4B isoform X2 n=1 Tax=Jatropha curcas TaxID=180498 RepID=UPI0009D677D3|nr:protein TIFY 4B isoform X2 [Jatropha curcas]
MDAGVTPFRSILDKPLTQLTEEDISQLTREDCRKYLKEKGMRRPSWNKSQAIQQVISLKALLETNEDSGAGALRKILVSKPPATSNSADSVKEPSDTNNNTVSVSADETAPCRQNDSPKSTPLGPVDCQPEEADNKAIAPRSPGAKDGLLGQMTIFYCGKVNVYDGVPPDKAQAIMHLAASPFQSPPDDTICRPAFSYPCHFHAQTDKHGFVPPNTAICQTTQTDKMTEYAQQYREKANATYDPDVEGQANRKVSLQRYLEKKKDRGRFKAKKNIGSTSNLEAYLNHHVRTHTSNGQSTRSSTSSPPQPGFPHTLCGSADDQPKIASFSVDLNEGPYLFLKDPYERSTCWQGISLSADQFCTRIVVLRNSLSLVATSKLDAMSLGFPALPIG